MTFCISFSFMQDIFGQKCITKCIKSWETQAGDPGALTLQPCRELNIFATLLSLSRRSLNHWHWAVFFISPDSFEELKEEIYTVTFLAVGREK